MCAYVVQKVLELFEGPLAPDSLSGGWFLTHSWGFPYTVVFLSAADSLCADMEKPLRGGKRPAF